MSQDNEASSCSSSRPATSKPVAEGTEFLLNESKQLREEVHSCKTLQTLIFFSRVINTAFEALNTMIDTFNAMNPSSEAEDIANCCKEACDVNKEVRVMLSNVIQTSPSTSNAAGGYKKVPMWKKQCNKNIDKIELLIKEAFAREFLTWFDAFAFHGMFHGFSGVLACLYNFLAFDDDQSLKTYAEMILETFENTYRDIVCKENAKLIQGIKRKEEQLLEELNLKSSPKEEEGEQEVLEKSQEDDIVKGFQEQCSVSRKSRQKEEMGQEMIQDKEEVQKNSQEAEINKKLQEAETQEKSQGDEALKKIQEEEALLKLEEEEELNELHLVEETQEKLQKDEEMKSLTKEEALKKLQEEDTQNKLQEEVEEALKKIQDEETQKNSQKEEAALMESQMEENAGEKIVKFGYLTFKMKNGVLERVLD